VGELSTQGHSGKQTFAVLALLAGAVAIATSALFVKVSEAGPVSTAFWRVFLALPFLWAWALFGGRESHRASFARDRRLMIAAGLFFAGDLAVWHWSIVLTSVANATLLANLAPIFVTLAAWLLFRKRPTMLFVTGLATALIGVTLLLGGDFSLGGKALIGDALGVVTAIFYAGYQLTVTRLRSGASTASIMAWSGLITAVALLPAALFSGEQIFPVTTMGWIKLDVLGLRALSAISDACDIIAAQTGKRPDLNALRFDDPEVYALIRRGNALGIFQVESRAQASLIPRFQPKDFHDLTIEISLIRPGPVQGGMVHPYLNRRDGIEPARYLHPLLQPALEETLGIILFQEQVLKVARDLAGFTPGEGELLRRALGNKRAKEQIESFRERFIAGAQRKGVPLRIARQVFEQLAAFGSYSFAKSHASAFAVLTYWSAWLKRYHPLAFFAGILRHEPMGFYAPHVVVSDAMRSGVKFLPVDVRYSQARTTVEGDAVRLGLDYVRGFGAEHIEVLINERGRRRFTSLADLVKRTGLDRPHVEALVQAGALDYLGDRRQLLWDIAEAFRLAKRPRELPLKSPDEQVRLKSMDRDTRLSTTFAFTGVSLDGHLTELRRDAFTQAGARSISELSQLKHGQEVKVGGLIVTLQRPPTAKGFAFLALEDPTGLVNVVVAPQAYAQYREAIHSTFVIVDGVVQKDHGAINVVAAQVRAI